MGKNEGRRCTQEVRDKMDQIKVHFECVNRKEISQNTQFYENMIGILIEQCCAIIQIQKKCNLHSRKNFNGKSQTACFKCVSVFVRTSLSVHIIKMQSICTRPEGIWRIRGVVTFSLNLGTTWRSVGGFTSLPFNPRQRPAVTIQWETSWPFWRRQKSVDPARN